MISGLERSPGGGNDNSLQYSCSDNPIDRGAWWATVHGVTKSQSQRVGKNWKVPSGKPTVYGITYQREYSLLFAFPLTSSLAELNKRRKN